MDMSLWPHFFGLPCIDTIMRDYTVLHTLSDAGNEIAGVCHNKGVVLLTHNAHNHTITLLYACSSENP